jgi:serine/threonine protein kinase
MSPERVRRIEELYHSARERKPWERSAFLASACKGDAKLQQEIESLLGDEGSLFDEVAWKHAHSLLGDDILAAGTQLGPYRVTAALGSGGMGQVYRAKDTKLKREVALKVLPEAFADDPGRMARFQREAEVLAYLNHPNIAQIYGVEERALVMELVEGESPKGPMPFDEAWKIASQIAAGLEYAHEKGIVHRDLKPANIKITPDGVVKLWTLD